MHQSWMLRIHAKYMFSYCFGTNSTAPFSTASIAGPASGAILTNHCAVSHGSTIAFERSPRGTVAA